MRILHWSFRNEAPSLCSTLFTWIFPNFVNLVPLTITGYCCTLTNPAWICQYWHFTCDGFCMDHFPGKKFSIIFLYQCWPSHMWSPVYVYGYACHRVPLHIVLWKVVPAQCIMQCLSWSLVYWKNMLNMIMFHVQPFLQCLSCTQSHSKVILHNVYVFLFNLYAAHGFVGKPMLNMVSLEILCWTWYRWKAYAKRSFMKSLSRTLIFGESLSYTVLRKVYAAHW